MVGPNEEIQYGFLVCEEKQTLF